MAAGGWRSCSQGIIGPDVLLGPRWSTQPCGGRLSPTAEGGGGRGPVAENRRWVDGGPAPGSAPGQSAGKECVCDLARAGQGKSRTGREARNRVRGPMGGHAGAGAGPGAVVGLKALGGRSSQEKAPGDWHMVLACNQDSPQPCPTSEGWLSAGAGAGQVLGRCWLGRHWAGAGQALGRCWAGAGWAGAGWAGSGQMLAGQALVQALGRRLAGAGQVLAGGVAQGAGLAEAGGARGRAEGSWRRGGEGCGEGTN